MVWIALLIAPYWNGNLFEVFSQLDEVFFRSHSDYIIHNNGNIDTVNGIACEVSAKIRELYNNKQTPVQVQ